MAMNRTCIWMFLAGAVIGGAVVVAARNEKARKIALKAVGKGLQLKDEAAVIVESLKEGIEDFLAEATEAAQAEEAPVEAPVETPAPKAKKTTRRAAAAK